MITKTKDSFNIRHFVHADNRYQSFEFVLIFAFNKQNIAKISSYQTRIITFDHHLTRYFLDLFFVFPSISADEINEKLLNWR